MTQRTTITDAVNVEFLQAFSDAWNRHDIEALMTFMTDDCQFHAVAGPDVLGKSFIGRDQVRAGFQLAWETFADAAWSNPRHFISGDNGVSARSVGVSRL